MKKVVVLGLASLCLLTGCGNKVVCKGTQKESGKKVTMKVTATMKSDKVDKVSAKMTFSDKKDATEMCGLMELANSFAEKDSDKIDVKCKGKTIEIKDYAKMSGESTKGMKKADFIKAMEAQDLTCK